MFVCFVFVFVFVLDQASAAGAYYNFTTLTYPDATDCSGIPLIEMELVPAACSAFTSSKSYTCFNGQKYKLAGMSVLVEEVEKVEKVEMVERSSVLRL